MHHDERGQILVTTAAALFVLLVIAALVIDVGFSWMLRRQEQNAADPGAIAAARWLKDPATGQPVDPATVQAQMDADACFYAQQNGFFSGDGNCTQALASGNLVVKSPPVSGPYAGRDGFVQVTITRTHPSFFGRILGQTTAVVATSATAANTAGNSNSSSLVALKNTDCSGGAAGNVNGGGTVRIFPANTSVDNGGYVHVNQPCGSSSDNVCANGVGNSSLQISGTLITPYAYVGGSCTYNGSGANGLVCPDPSIPCLTEQALPMADPLAGLPKPNLADFPDGVCPDGIISTPLSTKGCSLPPNGQAANTYCPLDSNGINVCHLEPGVYYGGWTVGSKVRLELDPGMYILAGGGISLSGTSSSIEAVSNPTGVEARITIFSTDGPHWQTIAAQRQGAIKFTAQQAFQAKATNEATCGIVTPNACPWKGILVWQDGTGSNPTAPVELGGQSSTVLAGTIYAPKANVAITGGQNTTGCTGSTAGCLAIQIISWTWTITGNATLDMPYDPAGLYQLDQRGLVH
jgi:Flp pilus assembly protein TadG